MISVILYGRNDAHGYNLHKRSAISLNCIAEVLGDADDEILFVDNNTPNDLPTFIEAIYDTLTPKAKSRLRVFRVRPELHARLAGPTHLFALEPHSRNIAIRRSNPRNRWILLTNTDMIFIPRGDIPDLAGAVRDLPDGQYIVPRFELPEPLWEFFPRSDPEAILRACRELGPKLHLDEVSAAFPYMRFDQPGDFQLAPRQALFEIHGFDERMIHGWHADSNMCKRLYLFYGGRTESLAHRVKGYHCDHTRVATLAHRMDIKLENNLQEFVYGVEDPVAHHQAATWGAPTEAIEELNFASDPPARFADAVERSLGAPQSADYHSDANELRNFVYYRPEHILPHLAGNLTVYPRHARFAYIGNNRRMLELAARCVAELGFAAPLHAVLAGTPEDGLLSSYDLLIFDFGLDLAGGDPGSIRRVTDWPRELRYSLGAVARSLENCATQSDAAWRAGGHVPDFLVINANHYVFRQFVGQFLLATDTPFHTRVRKGRPRVGDERLYRSHNWKETEDLMRSWFGYDPGSQDSVCEVAPGFVMDLTSAGRSAHLKDGHWGAMDSSGTWIEGYRAAILFAPPASCKESLLAFVHVSEAFIGPEEEPLRLQVFLEGELMARWTVYLRFEPTVCKVQLPVRLLAGKSVCRLEFLVENPQSAERVAKIRGQALVGEDPRELSLKIKAITFTAMDRLACPLQQPIDFTEAGAGAWLTDECWAPPDSLGSWTLGPEAGLNLFLAEPVEDPIAASFLINDAAVSQQYPNVDVAVALNGRDTTRWTIGTRSNEERQVIFPAGVLRAREPVHISFRIDAPRTPRQLQWSGNTRPLGFRLNSLRLAPAAASRYELGEVIDFADVGNSLAFLGEYLGAQWATPDRFGCWTIGARSTMRITFQTPPQGALPATFIISDCNVGEKAPQLSVLVKANGETVGEWVFGPDREARRLSVDLPAKVVADCAELILVFETREPRPAAALGWTTDPRLLGVRLSRAVIGRSELDFPMFDPAPSAPRGVITRARSLIGFALHALRLALKRLA